jgi:hypothetical protein
MRGYASRNFPCKLKKIDCKLGDPHNESPAFAQYTDVGLAIHQASSRLSYGRTLQDKHFSLRRDCFCETTVASADYPCLLGSSAAVLVSLLTT